MLRNLLFLLAMVSVYGWFRAEPAAAQLQPGMLADSGPVIFPIEITPWQRGDYTISAIEGVFMRARVLAKAHYTQDRQADLSPYDLVLGWESMSNPAVMDAIKIGQSNRWYYYHWSDRPPIPTEKIPLEIGNMHIIPADSVILETLERIAKGDVIWLQGYLVRVQAKDGWKWASGTGADSTGPHGCKLIWVTSLTTIW